MRGLPDLSCEAPEKALFERNVQPGVNETIKTKEGRGPRGRLGLITGHSSGS